MVRQLKHEGYLYYPKERWKSGLALTITYSAYEQESFSPCSSTTEGRRHNGSVSKIRTTYYP